MRLRLGHLLQHRAEANAALACKRGGFRDRALVGVGAGKTDADLVTAKHRPLAPAPRVLVIDEFAFPFAVSARVAAEIIEEAIAAADSAIEQQHDAGIAAVDAIEHPDVNGVKTVRNAALSYGGD